MLPDSEPLSLRELSLLAVASELSILLMCKYNLSIIGLDPNDDGEGNGCDPVMKTDSERGVWLPPLPFDGGTPTSFVGGPNAFADEAASSD